MELDDNLHCRFIKGIFKVGRLERGEVNAEGQRRKTIILKPLV